MSDLVGNPEDRFSHNEAQFEKKNLRGTLGRNGQFLAQIHKVQRAVVVILIPVTLAVQFLISPYLDNHLSESIHTWTIGSL